MKWVYDSNHVFIPNRFPWAWKFSERRDVSYTFCILLPIKAEPIWAIKEIVPTHLVLSQLQLQHPFSRMNPQISQWCVSAKPFFAVVFLQFGLAGMDILSKAALNQGMSNYVLVVYRHAVATIVIAPFALIFDKYFSMFHSD